MWLPADVPDLLPKAQRQIAHINWTAFDQDLANYRFSLSSCYVMCFRGLGLHKENLLEDISHLRHAEVGCDNKRRLQAGVAGQGIQAARARIHTGTESTRDGHYQGCVY